MSRRAVRQLFCALPMLVLCGTPAQAALISVAGPLSNLGGAAAIVAAPANVLDDGTTNSAQWGFNEAQGVLTTVAHAIDGGTLAAGTLVDSHMIFLNSQGTTLLTHNNVVWTFSGPILGVMSNSNGSYEAASSFELGAGGTNYTVGPGAAPFTARGLEPNDSYIIAGNTLTVSMGVSEPGDWIRVVTAASVPEPASVLLLGGGLASLLVRRRRR